MGTQFQTFQQVSLELESFKLDIDMILLVSVDFNPPSCIFVGSSHAIFRERTKILCSVQNGHTSKACTKMLRDLNFVHRQAAGEPAR